MKKVIFTLVILSFLFSANGQQKKVANNYSQLSSITQLISWSDIYNGMNELPGYESKVVKMSNLPKVLDDYLEIYELDGDKDKKKQAVLFKKNKEKIIKYLEDSNRFGETRGSVLIYDTENLPFGFATYNNSLVFYQTGIYSDHAYNTLRLNSDQRALKAAKDIALPTLYNVKNLTNIPELGYFLIIVGYTAKDFSSDSVADSDAETIGLLVSKSNVVKYQDAGLTDEQLLKTSILYNANKASGSNLKKISTQ